MHLMYLAKGSEKAQFPLKLMWSGKSFSARQKGKQMPLGYVGTKELISIREAKE